MLGILFDSGANMARFPRLYLIEFQGQVATSRYVCNHTNLRTRQLER